MNNNNNLNPRQHLADLQAQYTQVRDELNGVNQQLFELQAERVGLLAEAARLMGQIRRHDQDIQQIEERGRIIIRDIRERRELSNTPPIPESPSEAESSSVAESSSAPVSSNGGNQEPVRSEGGDEEPRDIKRENSSEGPRGIKRERDSDEESITHKILRGPEGPKGPDGGTGSGGLSSYSNPSGSGKVSFISHDSDELLISSPDLHEFFS